MIKPTAIGLFAMLILTSCDAVRLPSAEPAAPEPVPSAGAAAMTVEAAEERPAARSLLNVIEPDIAPPPFLEPVVIDDLAAVNAAICGLPMQPPEDSMTLAEVTGAEPAATEMIGTATINGTMASLYDFPGLVKMEPRAIMPNGDVVSGHCSATRIDENWFVTAAHCLDADFDEVSLIFGSETLSSPLAQTVEASASICHAAYGGAGYNYMNDIALVRVEDEDLPALSRVPIVPFEATEKKLVPLNYSEASMAGWGLTSFRGALSDTLLSASLAITGTGPALINVSSQEGAGPCIGDSGGPLFVDEEDGTRRLVGILSVVEQNLETETFCEGDYGARYTNLAGYHTWLTEVVTACESNSGLCGF